MVDLCSLAKQSFVSEFLMGLMILVSSKMYFLCRNPPHHVVVRPPFFESTDRMSVENGHENVIRKYVIHLFSRTPAFLSLPAWIEMATTVMNGNDCFKNSNDCFKRQRPFTKGKIAASLYSMSRDP